MIWGGGGGQVSFDFLETIKSEPKSTKTTSF